ncbi:hypothetical protein AQUCO_00900409v1 [Aquilegia coerulea]|uniref:Bifunctional inhibitor/plant lipid transfer protein/seed storage helical domain-containing protein n=1 Tax=Aquilegia coerulea TaxID=218851 RepID=A0A2G5EDH1_AQUCA|nr:hypothetical protein AQUCO_00900409v1 [Aquilegia coerulea]
MDSSSSSSNLLFLTIILLSSSWVSMGLDLEQFGLAAAADHVAQAGASMSCMQKLLPCQDYLNSETAPPSSCCVPLKEMIADNSKCLCNVINDPTILKTLNVTQEIVLKFAGACDAKVDVGVCTKDATTPPTSADSAESPSVPATPSNGSSNNTTKSSANGLSQVGGYGVITLFMSLFMSAAL